jgi:hypothetical protein
MERHEIKALVDGRMEQGKKSLDAMKARARSERWDADAKYRESVEQLQREHDEMTIRAARAWDASDDEFDAAGKDLQRSLDDWEARVDRTKEEKPE